MDDPALSPEPRPGGDPTSSSAIWVTVGLLAMVAAGFMAYHLLKPKVGPPPAAIANDPLLVEGRSLFLERCATCHGASGRGDGPVAQISETPPGNLTDDEWKYGDRPEDVLKVISQGLGQSMPGWGTTFRADQIEAVAAYVYALAGREVPAALRASATGPDVDAGAASPAGDGSPPPRR